MSGNADDNKQCCGGGCGSGGHDSGGLGADQSLSGPDAGRRAFLRGAVAAAVVTLAPGVMLYSYGDEQAAAASLKPRAPDQPASAKIRWGMLIDVNKCPDGCNECVTACSTENGWKHEAGSLQDSQWVRKVTVRDRKSGAKRSFPVMCQHCAEPPCVDVCPTGASFKRADGIVLVDKHICIGCRYCMMACPYNARSFVHETLEDQKPYAPRGKGTVESCTLCVHRVDKGRPTACVEACAKAGHDALLFGDLNDPSSEIAKRVAQYPTHQIRADLGVDPGVHYQNI